MTLLLFNLLWIPSIKRHNFFVFINLKEAEEAPFWEKVNKKHLKDAVMTDAVKKKIDAGSKKIADNYCKIVYGATPGDLLIEAKIEASIQAKIKMGLTAEQIAQTLDLDLVFVQSTLDSFNKKA
jgi:hypothetical protein